MKRWLIPLVLGLLLVAPAAGSATLSEGWAHVQEALENGDAGALNDTGRELLTVAGDLGVKRLTPYARALLSWGETNSGPVAETAVRLAERFDPRSPEVAFHHARVRWSHGSYLRGIRDYARGWFLLLGDWSARREILLSLAPWWLLALAGALAVGVVWQTARFLPELFHDGWELGRLLFSRSNAVVFAAVLVLLPIFAGLGPVWLLGWLFALSWSYLDVGGRITAAVVWLLVLALIPLNAVWIGRALRPAGAPAQAVAMLLEDRADPSVLQELADLGEVLGSSESYRLVAGALFRLHGDDLSARVEFQKAALSDENDPRPLIFLGNVALDDGNPSGAIQFYRQALQRDPRNAMAYYNLSRAYDRTYRFEEADQMRRKAEVLSDGRPITSGQHEGSTRVLDPVLGWSDLKRMRAEVGPQTWKSAGLGPAALDPAELAVQPIPMAFFFTGLFGIVLALARRRWMWTSTACARCGKVFCPQCKTATESDAYCSQCISVFLKRDAVAIEQQAIKVEQIRRREAWENLGRRVAALVMPGSGEVLLGRWKSGMLSAFFTALFVLGAALWLPAFVAALEPEISTIPVQIVFFGVAALLWLRSVMVSWKRR
ncbi:MAG: tetratricopeptide repeat protein [Acidobacteria bacterium]|nr:tetratricopeptide repeat protein [Acidobacteriota bacterium]